MFFKQNNPDMEKKTEEYENVVKPCRHKNPDRIYSKRKL